MEHDGDLGSDQLTQLYFWGGHGGVGGGDQQQLESSDCTLRFCVEEMQRRAIPLDLNMNQIPEYGNIEVEGPEVKSSRVMKFVERVTGKYIRPIPSLDLLHPLAIRRYRKCPSWRPPALRDLHDDLLAGGSDGEGAREEEE